jgi:hypothetical protein
MTGRMLRAVLIALAVQAPTAAVARADGLPVLGFETGTHGVRTLDGARRYVARSRRRETIVTATTASGRTLASTPVPGTFDVPVVAYDGSAAGLSASGRTLVLIRPRLQFPQRSTELAILAARPLRLRRFARLRGDFSFDAISPNGRWVYLIQYTSGVDPTRYRVRALSTGSGKLRARDIVDPHDRGEAMHGRPLTRVSSADGRWAYTLYDGNGQPFVHALDTARLQARCIDVAAFPPNTDPWGARLRLAGHRLKVTLAGRTLSEIDTRSLSLLAPARPADRVSTKKAIRPSNAGNHAGSGAIGVAFPIAAAILVLAGAILAAKRRFGPVPRRAQAR